MLDPFLGCTLDCQQQGSVDGLWYFESRECSPGGTRLAHLIAVYTPPLSTVTRKRIQSLRC